MSDPNLRAAIDEMTERMMGMRRFLIELGCKPFGKCRVEDDAESDQWVLVDRLEEFCLMFSEPRRSEKLGTASVSAIRIPDKFGYGFNNPGSVVKLIDYASEGQILGLIQALGPERFSDETQLFVSNPGRVL